MTTTTTARRRLAVLWTGACLSAGIGILAMDSGQGEVATSAATQESIHHSTVAQASAETLAVGDERLIAQAGTLVPDTDLTVDQAREVIATANRVCDGLATGSPEGFMIREVATGQGLTLPEAHAFVEAAMAFHC